MSEMDRRAEHLATVIIRTVNEQFERFRWERGHGMAMIVTGSLFTAGYIIGLKSGLARQEMIDVAKQAWAVAVRAARESERAAEEGEPRRRVSLDVRTIDFLQSVRDIVKEPGGES